MKYVPGPARIYVLLSFLYIALLLLAPSDQTATQGLVLSGDNYQKLLIVTQVPLVLLCGLSYLAYRHLSTYTGQIVGSQEESGFNGLARGCKWLSWGLLISALLSVSLNYLALKGHDLHPAMIIFQNYVSLIFPVVAFSIMYDSTHRIAGNYLKQQSRVYTLTRQIALMSIGVVYSYLVLNNLAATALDSSDNPYYLPAWIIILSLMIPYLYAWFLGILAALNMFEMSQHTPGLIYRTALKRLAAGFIIVIGSMMLLQYVHSFDMLTTRSALQTVLTTYIVYGLTVCGFAYIILAVRKMSLFEEV